MSHSLVPRWSKIISKYFVFSMRPSTVGGGGEGKIFEAPFANYVSPDGAAAVTSYSIVRHALDIIKEQL